MSLQVFPIDFVRGALELAFLKNRDNADLFNDCDIQLFTFYEHLATDEEVNRYVERIKDLYEAQNKFGIIGSGILSTTSTNTIINNKQVFITPFEWSCAIRCTLENRDKMLDTLYKAFEELRGRKTDIACMNNGKLQAVGTIGNGNDDYIHDYDFIGSFSEDIITNTLINTRLFNLTHGNNDFSLDTSKDLLVFIEHKGKLELWKGTYNEGYTWEIVNDLLYEHDSFTKYKLSLSFTDIKATEPYMLEGVEFFEISFGGGATLTTNNVKLGNDLVKVRIAKNKVVGETDFSFKVNDALVFYTLDPQEKTSGNSAGTIENKLKSNFFKTNTHTDSISITRQFNFVYDTNIELLNQWYKYANYGINNLSSGNLQQTSMTPNIIYTIREITNSWCNIEMVEYNAKIVEDIEISDTDSDVLTIGLSMQIQGDNN